MRSLLKLILIFGVGLVLLGGYLGVVPKLSDFMGTSGARNLGVNYSNINPSELYSELGTEVIPVKNDGEMKMEGLKEVSYSMTQEEISALANATPWKYFPFSQVQVKINEDGTIEAATVVKIEKLLSFAESLGYSSEQVSQAMEKYKLPLKDMPVYVKSNGSVTDNKINANISYLEIGRIPVPSSIVEKALPEVIKAGDAILSSFPGFYAKSMTFANGKMNFEGSIPEKQYLVTE